YKAQGESTAKGQKKQNVLPFSQKTFVRKGSYAKDRRRAGESAFAFRQTDLPQESEKSVWSTECYSSVWMTDGIQQKT
ncbi:MAG: hypothetical protein II079_04715, partial [Oscillospiraceae bacterium]|nr:hypothetical protein [Oscillospiraceae bacterium]